MRRILVAMVLLLSVIAVGAGRTHAQVISTPKGCVLLPEGVATPCPATPAPTAIPVAIDKELNVGGGLSEPLGFTEYTVQITSRATCFPLDEPIYLRVSGSPNAAVLRPATPGAIPVQNPDNYLVNVDQSGNAVLSLEVLSKFVGPGGLGLSAVWPNENLVRNIQLYGPATPAPTEQGVPAPTDTPLPPPTSTPTAGPTETASPIPSPTSAGGEFFLRECLTPNPVPAGSGASVYVQTLPGAACSLSVLFSNGNTVPDLVGEIQSPGPSGVAGFTFTADPNAAMGLATATCTFQGQSLSTHLFFNIVQPT